METPKHYKARVTGKYTHGDAVERIGNTPIF